KVADTIVDQLNSTDAQMRVAQLRVLGGAMARVPVDDTAFAHRRSKIMANVAALYGSPDQASVYEPWVHRFVAALKQSGTVADVLPNAKRRTLEGQTHNVDAKALAPVLEEFLGG